MLLQYIGIIFALDSIKQFVKKLLQFAGFKYSHLTNQEIKESRDDMGLGLPKDVHSNSHFIIYGRSGSGKTSFLKHYLGPYTTATANAQQQVKYLVFGRDEREFPSQNFYHYCSWRMLVLNNLLIRLLYWMMQVHTRVSKQK